MPISKIDATAIDSTAHLWDKSSNIISYTAGNVGIGTASPGSGVRLDVLGGEIKAGRVDSSSEGGQVSFGRASDNNTAWYIDAYGNTSTPSLRFVDVGAGAVSMGINSSGAVALRGAVSASGVGITFPATQVASTDANTLDDYEEGTFTPTFSGSSSNPTVTGSIFGSYVKIGRMVSVHVQWQMSYTGGSGVMSFALPFVVVTGYSHGHCGCIGPLYSASFPGSGAYPVYNCRADAGGTQLALWYSVHSNIDGQWTFANSSLGQFGSMSLVYDTTA
jgi:hypothetical protein